MARIEVTDNKSQLEERLTELGHQHLTRLGVKAEFFNPTPKQLVQLGMAEAARQADARVVSAAVKAGKISAKSAANWRAKRAQDHVATDKELAALKPGTAGKAKSSQSTEDADHKQYMAQHFPNVARAKATAEPAKHKKEASMADAAHDRFMEQHFPDVAKGTERAQVERYR